VAGKGVRLTADTENNRWVVEADETVLWEGTPTNSKTLSEPLWNFERIRIEFYDGIDHPTGSPVYTYISVKNTSTYFNVQHVLMSESNFGSDWELHNVDSAGTGVSLSKMKRVLNSWSNNSFVFQTQTASLITKIVGINRVASA
jgi:hypothetical protein